MAFPNLLRTGSKPNQSYKRHNYCIKRLDQSGILDDSNRNESYPRVPLTMRNKRDTVLILVIQPWPQYDYNLVPLSLVYSNEWTPSFEPHHDNSAPRTSPRFLVRCIFCLAVKQRAASLHLSVWSWYYCSLSLHFTSVCLPHTGLLAW